jgi:hypothetical protein
MFSKHLIEKEFPAMDPITLCHEVPIASLKTCIGLIKEKRRPSESDLAAILTVVGFAGLQVIRFTSDRDEGGLMFNSNADFDLEVTLDAVIQHHDAGGVVEMHGLIPWDKVAKAVVEALLEHFKL